MLDFGTVEDRNDPKEMGRVKVRVFGMHSSDKINDIPTASLPWAPVMNPTTTPGTSGLGQTPFLVPGSWVVVQFLDNQKQSPIVMGSINGFPDSKPNSENGFADPVGTFPREIEESDIERRARGVNDIANKKLGVGSEPKDPYNAKYPYNRVTHSESGHMIEMDDTPGHERVHIFHRTGAFVEIHPDGSMVVHSASHYNSSQKLEINVTDTATVNVGGDLLASVNGTTELNSTGNITVKTKGNSYVTTEGNSYIKTFGNTDVQTQGNINVKADGTLSVHSSGDIIMSSKGAIDIVAGTTFKLGSVGAMNLKGSTVDLNAPGVTASNRLFVDYTDDETAQFKPDIDGESGQEVPLGTPLYSVIEPTGNASTSKQTESGVTIPRKDQSTSAQTTIPNLPAGMVAATNGVVIPTTIGSLTYQNAYKIRNLKLQPQLEQILVAAVNATGYYVDIFSGGQNPRGKTVGTSRHDNGWAADLHLYTDKAKNNQLNTVTNASEVAKFIQAARDAGATSAGAGADYMGDVGIHIDIAQGNSVGIDAGRHWAKNNTSLNSPAWLKGIMA
jgi:hypothetical protein